MEKAHLIAIGILIGYLLFKAVSLIGQPKITTYPIVDKYEHDGKCYLTIEQEITPEEYIGYDIEDEYEVHK